MDLEYEDVTKLNFLREYADIRKQILTLSSGQIDADFVMKDFKGDVNVHNARIASQFKRQVENDNGELQKLEEKKNKALKKYNKIKEKYEKAKIPTKKLKKELEKAEIALQEATNNYSSKEISIKMKLESSTTPAEPIKKYGKFDSLLKNADNLKNFVLVKKFTPADEIGLTNDEKNILSKLDFDLTSGKFTYKHKSYSFDTDFTKTTDKNAEIFGVISKIKTKMAELSSITYETENTGIEYTDVIKPVEQQEVISENVQENTAEVVAENELETVNEESSEVETEENLVQPLEVQPQEELHGESQRLRAPSMYSGPFKKSKLEILSSVVSNMEFVAKFVNVSSDTLAKGEKLKKELEDAIFVVTQFSPLLEAFIEKYKGLTVQDKNNVKAVVLDLFARYNKVKDVYVKSVNNFNNVSGNFEV